MKGKLPRVLVWTMALLFFLAMANCRSHNYNGLWQGQTSEGKTISFTISDNAITRAKLECKLQCQLGGFCPTESSFEGDVTAKLEGSTFSASLGTANFSGKFDSDSACSGELVANTTSPQCGECKAKVTWTAKKL